MHRRRGVTGPTAGLSRPATGQPSVHPGRGPPAAPSRRTEPGSKVQNGEEVGLLKFYCERLLEMWK